MNFPTLKAKETFREVIDVFGGYNHKLRIGEGEFYDMKNLTSDAYPILSTRRPRGMENILTGSEGITAKDGVCYVNGGNFFVGDKEVDGLILSTNPTGKPKTLISMGAYILIFPDKKYVNVQNTEEYGDIEAIKEVSPTAEAPVIFSLCDIDGNEYTADYHGAEVPTSPKNGDYWLDTSSTPRSLKQYSEATASWTSVATTYVKITHEGIGVPFAQYDGITVEGLEGEEISALNGSAVVWSRGDNYLVVVGLLDGTVTVTAQEAPMTFSRLMPYMDFVTASQNRLWGCRYGVSRNGQIVNEIYASKLGDFKNWNCFMGISTDSYAVSLGDDGIFTGAVTHRGYPIFFRENCMHKVYGSYPANYQIQTTDCRGVQSGCERSLAVVNEVLFYKARNGVCVYDGSFPQEISDAFGSELYYEASAIGHRNKYYISMRNGADEWNFFVYDMANGLWHREDDTHAKAFCSFADELYYIDGSDGRIRTVIALDGKEIETTIPWMAESGIFGAVTPDKKYVTRLNLNLQLGAGAYMRVLIQYDSLGQWEEICLLPARTLQSVSLPVRPRRCDHFRLRLEGEGEMKLLSLTKTLERGSDIG
ncbi:MAG: hypothetical protein IJD10_07055 [Clostridia bacterium]|nr:hypothetical protein [Clostridia bacterium]